MRYDKTHKALTRQRIVGIASRRFRKEGIGEVGLASLMADAGLTHGGFYGHFASKEDLVREATTDALETTRAELERVSRAAGNGLEAIVRAYLAPAHRERLDVGCAFATLAPEMSRRPAPTRAALEEQLRRYVDLIAAQLAPSRPLEQRRRTATAIFGLMVGTLQLARITADRAESDRILQSGVDAALALGNAR